MILLKNPFPELNSKDGYNIIAQQDRGQLCTGFFYLTPTKETIDVMKYAMKVFYRGIGDQAAVNRAVKELKPSVLLLPTDLFPSGFEFFKKYQYYWDRKGDEWMNGMTSRQWLLHLP